MKELAADRLNRMEDLEQRRLLRQILTGVFTQLAEHQETAFRQLEERVFREAAGNDELYTIYASVCHRDELDPIDEFMFPMIPEDANADAAVDAGELAASLGRGERPVLQSFYMSCSREQLHELLSSQRSFRGELETSEGTIGINVQLSANKAYEHVIEKLYRLFRLNSIPWTTVNHPYAYKFIQAELIECDRELDSGLEVHQVRIDLEEYERWKRVDWIPLWNVEQLTLASTGFPMPALDKINYEHVLPIRKTGSGHGYLVDAEEDELHYVKRDAHELIVVSPKEKAGMWSLWKVAQHPAETLPQTTSADLLVSNRRKPSFIGSFERKQAAVIRSAGDVKRLVHMFEAAEGMQLDLVELLPPEAYSSMDAAFPYAYTMNPFLTDTLRAEREKRVLRLGFIVPESEDPLFIQDRICFLTSEVQRHLPEYRVMGERL